MKVKITGTGPQNYKIFFDDEPVENIRKAKIDIGIDMVPIVTLEVFAPGLELDIITEVYKGENEVESGKYLRKVKELTQHLSKDFKINDTQIVTLAEFNAMQGFECQESDAPGVGYEWVRQAGCSDYGYYGTMAYRINDSFFLLLFYHD